MRSVDVGWIEKEGVLVSVPLQNVARHPLKVGVLFSGGPASGGNDVLVGLYDSLLEIHPQSELIGILGGSSGLLEQKTKKITPQEVHLRARRGGFDFLGTGRKKLETAEEYAQALKSCHALGLDGLVFIGGDDTNTNAYHLALYFKKEGSRCTVVGIPKTIDGDLKGAYIETSFGFDTASRVYGELIGNICIDAASSLKYTHFIRLMGRTASHIALECALLTQPNLTLISEEIAHKQRGLHEIVEEIVRILQERSKRGKNYAVILLPEGLIEWIPETKRLLIALNRIVAKGKGREELDAPNRALLETLPTTFQEMLLSERDPHGNVQVSKIETEKLLSQMVERRLKELGSSVPFNPMHHFFGYEGRCATPSLFDATYCHHLGIVASLLIRDRKSGTMACLQGLTKPPGEWEMRGVPLALLLGKEERKGEIKEVIKKTVVSLEGPVFQKFASQREEWKIADAYLSPGPMQLSSYLITNTLKLENKNFSEIPLL